MNFTWATKSSRAELERRGVDWRAYARSFGQIVEEGPAADFTDRVLSLGCLRGVSVGNLDHAGSWIYSDVSEELKKAKGEVRLQGAA